MTTNDRAAQYFTPAIWDVTPAAVQLYLCHLIDAVGTLDGELADARFVLALVTGGQGDRVNEHGRAA